MLIRLSPTATTYRLAMFRRGRVGFPVQFRPKADALKIAPLTAIPGRNPIFHLRPASNAVGEAVAECVPRVLAWRDVIEARRLTLHIRPTCVVEIGRAVDITHVSRRSVGVAQHDPRGQ